MRIWFVSFAVVAGATLTVVACGSSSSSGFTPDPSGPPGNGSSSGFAMNDAGNQPTGCTGLACQVVACANGGHTTLSGKAFAPNGADALYNVIAYVPNADLQPFPAGATCDQCGAITSGSPIVTALSASDGTFTLTDVPAGDNIPLVMQVGRWRRKVTIPHVDACTNTALTPDETRLPKSKAEGDIPLIALATSPYDPEECILRKMGIADSEFTAPGGGGRVEVYLGAGASVPGAPSSTALWATVANLQQYDMVLFPCHTSGYPDATGYTNIQTYANGGGRLFVTDLHQDVIKSSPAPWPSTASWNGSGAYAASMNAAIDTSFPKGEALAEWLVASGASTTKGALALEDTFERLTSPTPPSQQWISNAAGDHATQTYSFNTPVGVDPTMQCGRVVYSSFHIANGSGFGTFPSECNANPMTAQEKVLEFLLYDLAACIQTDNTPPTPPPVVR